MKNTFGNSITLTIFGESHGEGIGVVADGLCSGLPVDEAEIARLLSRRRPSGADATARREPDDFRIVSGVYNGKTTGTPLCILIPNVDRRSGDYKAMAGVARPSHADFAAHCRYGGFEDARGGGHFSGRVTTGLVAAGAIFEQILSAHGIRIGTHIKSCQSICDRDFNWDALEVDLAALDSPAFPVLDAESGARMTKLIEDAASRGDSVGAVLETAISGLPAGIGEPYFDSVESEIAHLAFSIPAVKGIEFGTGFGFAGMRGSEANDAFRMTPQGAVVTATNHNAGVNGGIANGMPGVFRTAVKPTPSIYKQQDTVDYLAKKDAQLSIQGRHDPCIVPRAAIVQTCTAALAVGDLLTARYGEAWMTHPTSFRKEDE
mgnify:CR=1 FL=1